MAPLFSKVDLNKLWHDVQNDDTFICAKFGKDLFNISKVIGRKKWPSFLTHSVVVICMDRTLHYLYIIIALDVRSDRLPITRTHPKSSNKKVVYR